MEFVEKSIEPLLSVLIQLIAALLLAFGTWAINRLIKWLDLQNSEKISLKLENALDKSITFGIQQVQDVIKEKGWDHIEVKKGAISNALPYITERFPDTLKAAGLDLSKKDLLNHIVSGALDRAFPDAATRAAESPATPPKNAPIPSTNAEISTQPNTLTIVDQK